MQANKFAAASLSGQTGSAFAQEEPSRRLLKNAVLAAWRDAGLMLMLAGKQAMHPMQQAAAAVWSCTKQPRREARAPCRCAQEASSAAEMLYWLRVSVVNGDCYAWTHCHHHA